MWDSLQDIPADLQGPDDGLRGRSVAADLADEAFICHTDASGSQKPQALTQNLIGLASLIDWPHHRPDSKPSKTICWLEVASVTTLCKSVCATRKTTSSIPFCWHALCVHMITTPPVCETCLMIKVIQCSVAVKVKPSPVHRCLLLHNADTGYPASCNSLPQACTGLHPSGFGHEPCCPGIG